MADKKDGITDLTKLLVTASKKFTKTEYSTLTSVVFAMLHGVNYGYNEMDQRFLNDALDIFEFNQVDDSNKVSTYHKQKIDGVIGQMNKDLDNLQGRIMTGSNETSQDKLKRSEAQEYNINKYNYFTNKKNINEFYDEKPNIYLWNERRKKQLQDNIDKNLKVFDDPNQFGK